jgi:alkylhydroperoxidase/carboxymuconolactone decarboxylase family protein YurZ
VSEGTYDAGIQARSEVLGDAHVDRAIEGMTDFTMHVRADRTNGVTQEAISEVVLHTAVYAGVPAANAASAIAHSVLAEEAAEP